MKKSKRHSLLCLSKNRFVPVFVDKVFPVQPIKNLTSPSTTPMPTCVSTHNHYRHPHPSTRIHITIQPIPTPTAFPRPIKSTKQSHPPLHLPMTHTRKRPKRQPRKGIRSAIKAAPIQISAISGAFTEGAWAAGCSALLVGVWQDCWRAGDGGCCSLWGFGEGESVCEGGE